MKPFVTFGCLMIIFTLATLVWYWEPVVYQVERLVLGNRSTIIFDCNEFPSYSELERILKSNPSQYSHLVEMVEANDGFVVTQKNYRCHNKYEFQIQFNNLAARQAIERVLSQNQKYLGIPVFLRNI